MKRIVLALGSIVLVAAVAITLSLHQAQTPRETFIRVEKGTGTVEIGRMLADAGVIRYPWQFWLTRALNPSAKLQAGEYRFNEPATVSDVFGRLARGDVYYFEFTVAEGNNIFDIAHALEAAGVMPADDFLRAAGDPSVIRDLAPKAPSLEGYLFPSTYRLTHSTTAAGLCLKMTDQFRKVWKKLATGKTADVHHTVTLASLVEKETGVASERPLIAGVFTNRLTIGMRLDCDPTTVYAALLENRYRHTIHRSDLESHNPYNTYQNSGLPPGPIANPGADAIAAALEPAETDFLYFVAKPQGGGHQFSATLAGHAKAAREYRNASKKPAKKARKAG